MSKLSPLTQTKNARIAATAGTAFVIGAAAVGTFVSGVSSGLIGPPAGADPFKGRSVSFPEELGENDHWIEFTAKETVGRGVSAINTLFSTDLSVGSTTLGGSIYLPMPASLQTDYNPEYSTPSLGSVAGMALKPSDQAIYGNNSMGGNVLDGQGLAGLGGALAKGGGALTGYGLFKGIGAADAAGGAVGAEGLAGALLKVAGGVAQNPHKIVLFTGVNFRDHTFSWKLSPKNREESDAIKTIIDMFVYYSHPEYVAGGLFFKYPEFFDIKFRHPEYLFRLQPSVCTDVRVNYHGSNYPAYIRDSDGYGAPAPADVELSLTFKETEIVTKQTLNPNFNAPTYRPRPAIALPESRVQQRVRESEEIRRTQDRAVRNGGQ
jgi:hypothetical protein